MTIPDSVTSVGRHAFEGCNGLASVTIGSGMTTVGQYAFNECTSLASVTIPDNVTSIGDWAFKECTNLTSVVIGTGVTSIGNGAFYNCDSLMSITVAGGNSKYSSVEGVLLNNDKTELVCYPAGKSATSYTIPDGVERIGSYAFRNCTALESVTIPNGVWKFGVSVFYGCKSLTSMELPDSVGTINTYTFAYCTSLTSVTIPDKVDEISEFLFEGCTALTRVDIPVGVTRIWQKAFKDCNNLKDIYYGGSEEQWKDITINWTGNEPLKGATIHFTTAATTYTVSFSNGGGTGSKADVTVNAGDEYTLPAADTFVAPTNKEFDKWSVQIGSASAIDKNPGDKITVTADTAVTAMWKSKAKKLTKLEITRAPDKKYTHGATIDKADMTVRATYSDGTIDYNFKGYTISYVNGGYLKKGDNTATVSYGGVTATVNLAEPVSAKKLSGSVGHGDRDYDGTRNVTIDVTLSGFIAGEDVSYPKSIVGTMEDADVGNDKPVSFEIPLYGADADNYIVPPFDPVTVNILPARVTISTDKAKKDYDGEPLTAPGGKINYMIDGETATVTATGSQTYVGSSENTYTIEWDTAKESNYQIVTEYLGTLTVTTADQNPAITAATTLAKGGSELDLTELVSGAKGDVSFSIKGGGDKATLSGTKLTSGDATGDVVISVSISAVDVNGDGADEYNAYTGDGVITVTVTDKSDAEVSIAGGDITKTYGDDDFALEYSVKNHGTNGETTFTTGSGGVVSVDATGNVSILRAGSDTITVNYESDTTIGTATITVTVNKADPTVSGVSVTAPATVYDNTSLADIVLGFTSDPSGGSVKLDDGQTLKVGENEYDWTYTPEDTDNYNTVSGKVKITVVKALAPSFDEQPTATANDTSVTVRWAVNDNGSPLTYLKVTVTPEGAGSYTHVYVPGVFTQTSIVAENLEYGKQYTFVVVATNAVGTTESEPVTITLVAPAPPQTAYTVTFNANGYGTAPAKQSVAEGATATKPADPTASGWKFGGWYKEKECKNAFDFTTPIAGNLTLYAKWTQNSGGSPTSPKTGDNRDLALWLALSLISAGGMIMLGIYGIRSRKKAE